MSLATLFMDVSIIGGAENRVQGLFGLSRENRFSSSAVILIKKGFRDLFRKLLYTIVSKTLKEFIEEPASSLLRWFASEVAQYSLACLPRYFVFLAKITNSPLFYARFVVAPFPFIDCGKGHSEHFGKFGLGSKKVFPNRLDLFRVIN